jgi:hypothetical protein
MSEIGQGLFCKLTPPSSFPERRGYVISILDVSNLEKFDLISARKGQNYCGTSTKCSKRLYLLGHFENYPKSYIVFRAL